MEEFPDPSGPPYPYEYPLPEQAEAEHRRAAEYFQRKLEYWESAHTGPAQVCVFLIALWAATDDDYLSGSALVICLIIGIVLQLALSYRVMVLSHEKDKHANLLKAYGVLPPATAKAALATQSKDFDRMHELQGKPLAREETAPQPTPRKPKQSLYDEPPRNGNPYSGVIRLSPPRSRPEIER
ncbi:hypothetical protein ACFWMR_00230 [Amycolatopsis thailandensis]|uniref:hypothetical protein n=1 Tax=Amycolatopsis thailandensis TaxID=589330 RepID=UPI00366599BC